jgi:23S rRNA pseudouridine1911/1915/1917 synthase
MSAVSRNNFDIIFENSQFIAINKPSGLLSIPDRFDTALPSLLQILSARYDKIFTVHRLDRDTSGLILFAKDEATHKYLSQLFEAHTVEKYYRGIVHGKPASTSGTIDAPIAEHPVHKGSMVVHRKGKEAKTDYEVLEGYSSYSLVQFRIHTGRTHQIRVHAKHTGHPIACDILYGDGKPVLVSSIKKKYKLAKKEEEERPILSRLALHAYMLSFVMPGGEPISLTAPMPKDMRALLQQLSKK